MLQQALQTNVEIDLKIYVNGEVRTFRHDCTSFHFLDNQRAAPFRSHKRRNCRFLSSPKLFLNIMMIFGLKLSLIKFICALPIYGCLFEVIQQLNISIISPVVGLNLIQLFFLTLDDIHYGTQLMPSVVFLPKNWWHSHACWQKWIFCCFMNCNSLQSARCHHL